MQAWQPCKSGCRLTKEGIMGKARDTKKEEKKQPKLTMKEKKKAKLEKKKSQE
jgi:hypothetical protein